MNRLSGVELHLPADIAETPLRWIVWDHFIGTFSEMPNLIPCPMAIAQSTHAPVSPIISIFDICWHAYSRGSHKSSIEIGRYGALRNKKLVYVRLAYMGSTKHCTIDELAEVRLEGMAHTRIIYSDLSPDLGHTQPSVSLQTILSAFNLHALPTCRKKWTSFMACPKTWGKRRTQLWCRSTRRRIRVHRDNLRKSTVMTPGRAIRHMSMVIPSFEMVMEFLITPHRLYF